MQKDENLRRGVRLYKLRILVMSSMIVPTRLSCIHVFLPHVATMFKTLLFAGLLAVAIAAPSPVPAPAPAPAPAPSTLSSSALIGGPLIAPLAPSLIPNIGSPLIYTSYPAPLNYASYVPSSLIYKNVIY